MKKNLIFLCLCTLLIVLSIMFLRIDTNYINLEPNQLDSLVSKTLQTQGSTYLPLNGVSYTLGKILYFQNKTWLIVPLRQVNLANTSLIVVHVQNGKDILILGPGSSFNSSQLDSLPSDVASYLRG